MWIRRWYTDRYGAGALKTKRDFLTGIAEFRGSFSRLNIPVSITKVEVEGETAWMIMPSSVHELEGIRGFFEFKPNLDALDEDDRQRVEEQVGNVVKWTRSINMSLQAVEDLPPERELMPGSIVGHFDKAIDDLLTKADRAPVACWELHLAVEKALKVLLAQNGMSLGTHDLVALADLAQRNGLLTLPPGIILLPHWKSAIQYRYAEAQIGTREAVGHYFTALEVVFEVTSKLRRFMGREVPAFLLKKPKWVVPE